MIFNILKKKGPEDIYENKLRAFYKVFNQFEWEDKKAVETFIQDAIIIEESKNKSLKITPKIPVSPILINAKVAKYFNF